MSFEQCSLEEVLDLYAIAEQTQSHRLAELLVVFLFDEFFMGKVAAGDIEGCKRLLAEAPPLKQQMNMTKIAQAFVRAADLGAN